MAKYSVIDGTFLCHECKEVVKTIRSYYESGTMTWMCSNKHLSRVELLKRKKI
jgi:hypothetical protein